MYSSSSQKESPATEAVGEPTDRFHCHPNIIHDKIDFRIVCSTFENPEIFSRNNPINVRRGLQLGSFLLWEYYWQLDCGSHIV